MLHNLSTLAPGSCRVQPAGRASAEALQIGGRWLLTRSGRPKACPDPPGQRLDGESGTDAAVRRRGRPREVGSWHSTGRLGDRRNSERPWPALKWFQKGQCPFDSEKSLMIGHQRAQYDKTLSLPSRPGPWEREAAERCQIRARAGKPDSPESPDPSRTGPVAAWSCGLEAQQLRYCE